MGFDREEGVTAVVMDFRAKEYKNFCSCCGAGITHSFIWKWKKEQDNREFEIRGLTSVAVDSRNWAWEMKHRYQMAGK